MFPFERIDDVIVDHLILQCQTSKTKVKDIDVFDVSLIQIGYIGINSNDYAVCTVLRS